MPERDHPSWRKAFICFCRGKRAQREYQGYIDRQNRQAQRIANLENMALPQDLDYTQVSGLSLEARQKLNAVKPATLGQAMRISGVSPADISVLLIYQKAYGKRGS